MRFKYTKGKTINDLMSMDISRLADPIKKEIVGRLYETANRRISKTTKKQREINPAYIKASKTGLFKDGKFSLRKNFYIPKQGINKGQKVKRSYEQMFYAARAFLKNDTLYKKAYDDFMKGYKTNKQYKEDQKAMAQSDVMKLDQLKKDVWHQIINKLKYDPEIIREKYKEIEELVDESIDSGESAESIYYQIEDKIDEITSEQLDYDFDFRGNFF